MTRFESICQTYMPRLINDLHVSVFDAAAVFGNGGHESGGFKYMQELQPTVKGSRGGYGWFQWTGTRRRAFEAFCANRGMKPSDDEANYLFLIEELRGPERKALPAMAMHRKLDDKVVAFELAFERAGVKHYPSRKAWALKALHAHEALHNPPVKINPPAGPVDLPDEHDDELAEIIQPEFRLRYVAAAALLLGILFTMILMMKG